MDIVGELEVTVEVEDLKARLRAAGKRRSSGALRAAPLLPSGAHAARARARDLATSAQRAPGRSAARSRDSERKLEGQVLR